MEELEFKEIGFYILNRQNMAAQYIVTQLILELCDRLMRRPGSWFSWRWWKYEGLGLAGARERAAVAADGEKERGGEEAMR